MKKQLLILMTLCTVVIVHSQTFTALDNNGNTLEFDITSATTVEVKDYISSGTDIDIPSSVSNGGTNYSVTSIGILAFNNNGLTSVIIPNSVTGIGIGAFQSNMLTSVVIPDGITSIANNTFVNNGLTSVTIPDSVISIGNNAFSNNALMSINIGNGTSTIGDFAFSSNQLTSITLPNSITTIGDIAFQGNPLTCIVSEAMMPPSINTSNSGLDTFTLAQRNNIDLSIPSGSGSAYAAEGWTDFNNVAEGLTGTFVVNNITYQINPTPNNEVTVTDYNTAGGSVVNIPSTVASACITFSVTEIGPASFLQKGLTSVEIPNSVTSIGANAFFNNTNLTSLLLQNGLVSIGDNTFNSCDLTNITIPSTVTTIGNFTFFGNPLTDVYSEAVVPPTITTGTNDTFASDRSNIHLHLPAGTVGAYVTDAGALWTGFNPVTEDALSVNDFELANNIKVIVTTDEIKIISPGSARLENYIIYSISGAKIKEGAGSNIAVNYLSNGIYIIKLNFDKGIVTKKVIIN